MGGRVGLPSVFRWIPNNSSLKNWLDMNKSQFFFLNLCQPMSPPSLVVEKGILLPTTSISDKLKYIEISQFTQMEGVLNKILSMILWSLSTFWMSQHSLIFRVSMFSHFHNFHTFTHIHIIILILIIPFIQNPNMSCPIKLISSLLQDCSSRNCAMLRWNKLTASWFPMGGVTVL